MARVVKRELGSTLVESAIALPIVFLSIFTGFAISEGFFLGSKMIHLSTEASISLRAVAQAGEQITSAPQFAQLTYPPNSPNSNYQVAWYNQGGAITGFDSTSQIHRMFLNLFLGTLKVIYPQASSPPPYRSGVVNLKNAVEAKLFSSTDPDGNVDTVLKLKSAPVLANSLKKLFFIKGSDIAFSTATTVLNMDIAGNSSPNVDNTYQGAAGGGKFTLINLQEGEGMFQSLSNGTATLTKGTAASSGSGTFGTFSEGGDTVGPAPGTTGTFAGISP